MHRVPPNTHPCHISTHLSLLCDAALTSSVIGVVGLIPLNFRLATKLDAPEAPGVEVSDALGQISRACDARREALDCFPSLLPPSPDEARLLRLPEPNEECEKSTACRKGAN